MFLIQNQELKMLRGYFYVFKEKLGIKLGIVPQIHKSIKFTILFTIFFI